MSEVVIYQMEDGKTNLEVQLDEETVWLNLNQIVALFGRDKSVVSRHINNIFREEELDRKAVVANFATTAADGKTYSDWKRIRASKVPSVRSIRHLTVRMSTPASRKRPLTYSTSSSRTMLFPTENPRRAGSHRPAGSRRLFRRRKTVVCPLFLFFVFVPCFSMREGR